MSFPHLFWVHSFFFVCFQRQGLVSPAGLKHFLLLWESLSARFSLYNPGWLQCPDPLAITSQVLGLQACTTELHWCWESWVFASYWCSPCFFCFLGDRSLFKPLITFSLFSNRLMEQSHKGVILKVVMVWIQEKQLIQYSDLFYCCCITVKRRDSTWKTSFMNTISLLSAGKRW